MPGQARRLVIGRAIGPDRVLRALLAAIDLDCPVGAIAFERTVGLVLGRAHQVEPHILLGNVTHGLVPSLLAAHRARRVRYDLAGKSDAHPPRFRQQVDAMLWLFLIPLSRVRHGCAPQFSESSRRAAAGSSGYQGGAVTGGEAVGGVVEADELGGALGGEADLGPEPGPQSLAA